MSFPRYLIGSTLSAFLAVETEYLEKHMTM